MLRCRAGRALKQVGVTVTNNCGQDVYIFASYNLNSSTAADYTQCVNSDAQEIMHCFEYINASGGYPNGDFDLEVTPAGETARTAGTIPPGEVAYVSVSYSPGDDALLEGYEPVWLASGKECPEGFEEACSLTYKVGSVWQLLAFAVWRSLPLGQARRCFACCTAHPSSHARARSVSSLFAG